VRLFPGTLLTYLLTYFEELVVAQLVKDFFEFYGNQMFFTVFAKACHKILF